MDPKLKFFQILRKIPTKSPFIIFALVGFISQTLTMFLIFYPYLMFEGQLSTFNLSVKAISISLGMGMLVPLFSVPPVANSAVSLNLINFFKKFSFSFGICLSFLFVSFFEIKN